ncbi:MAG: hypothetical protein WC827_01595 [Candidatus Paceibacterota bacterium]|jgi:hypothetical protein
MVKNIVIGLAVSLVVAFIGFLIWFALWVTLVDNYQMGFVFDKATGKIETVNHTGWVIRTPIRYSVHAIDLRPYQLTISANQRVLNAKLVRFNPDGLETFVEWHGRDAGDNTTWLLEILKCYAFDLAGGRDCPFLEVIQEIAPNQCAEASTNKMFSVTK